jgi:hypothetical protein
VIFSSKNKIQNYYHLTCDVWEIIEPFDENNPFNSDENAEDYDDESRYNIMITKTEKSPLRNTSFLSLGCSFELISFECFKKSGNINSKVFDKLNEKRNFSPELYHLKFEKNNELIIYFDTSSISSINFYLNFSDFINDINFRDLKLSDFVKQTEVS